MKGKKRLLLIIFSLNLVSVTAQNIPTKLSYPGVLITTTDTFYVKGSNWDGQSAFSINQSDTIDLGTNGFEGVNIKVWTDKDTLTIPYVNSPFKQWLYIPIGSAKDTIIYRMRFNEQNALYSDEYISTNRNRLEISIPEVYELANIILYLSDCSVLTGNHDGNTEYSKSVDEYFSTFRNHPLVKVLNNKCSDANHWSTYYGFRENSICYSFNEDNILDYNTPYKSVRLDNSDVFAGEFRNLLYLTQDFVNQTKFRDFYSQNTEYYKSLEARQYQLLPIDQMWKWLEEEFPQNYDSYKVFFSPLIEGSHSTQRFYEGDFKTSEFRECLMFINSPENLDSNNDYSEKLKEGLMSGIVFTEIDHNYVNPTSRKYLSLIKELISNKDHWATKEAQENYSNEYAIFNEYMTHSLFCLYVKEHYEVEIREEIIVRRIKLMERRGYLKFKTFNEMLLNFLENRETTIYVSYEVLINQLRALN